MSRNGYLFATADPDKTGWLQQMADVAADHGAGPVRTHDSSGSTYSPVASQRGALHSTLSGADIITGKSLIREHFPYLNPQTCVVAHARRAGWLSAQQLGMVMLEAARENGVRLLRGRIVNVDITDNQVRGVDVVRSADGKHQANGQSTQTLAASDLVIAAGPMLKSVMNKIGVDIPVVAERHLKISVPDQAGAIPGNAPMLVWLDPQHLPWTDEERALLSDDTSAQWLLREFPAGVHCRPHGNDRTNSGTPNTVLGLFNYDNEPRDVEFPLPDEPNYAEIVLRGLSTMVPGLQATIDSGVRPFVDGGYYIRTRENRPLIGPLPVEGLFVSAAYSGFGVMASCGGGDLLARHVAQAPLPDYAPAFMLSRYQDPAYVQTLENWGEDGQI